MTNVALAKKNYARGLWTDEMLDKLTTAKKITTSEKTKLKADVISEAETKQAIRDAKKAERDAKVTDISITKEK